jgi:uncharacterized membrane protein
VDKVNSYTCICLPGYVGKNCETGAYSFMLARVFFSKGMKRSFHVFVCSRR